MIANADDPHLRLHVHDAHFILGLDGADGLYARAVLVLLVVSVFYEPADGRGRRSAEKKMLTRAQTQGRKRTCCSARLRQTVAW